MVTPFDCINILLPAVRTHHFAVLHSGPLLRHTPDLGLYSPGHFDFDRCCLDCFESIRHFAADSHFQYLRNLRIHRSYHSCSGCHILVRIGSCPHWLFHQNHRRTSCRHFVLLGSAMFPQSVCQLFLQHILNIQ